jgi:protocatechuate 3,4-dioxygenase beta subunit
MTGRPDESDHDDFGGIERDLPKLMDRRRALSLVGVGLGAIVLAGCGSSVAKSAPSTTSVLSGMSTTSTIGSDPDGTSPANCSSIAGETTGPFPGDGTNGPDVLTQSGVVRSDITNSFGSMSGIAQGIALTMRYKVLDIANGCTPYAGAALYVWQSTREGSYSLYSEGVQDQNFLRGVQAADDDGWVTFQTVFPGCYDGRWPHVHFEVYPTVAKATNAANKIATSQLAFTPDICETVYSTPGYESSQQNLAATSLQNDIVFRDGWASQLGTVTGDVSTGLTVTLNVPV